MRLDGVEAGDVRKSRRGEELLDKLEGAKQVVMDEHEEVVVMYKEDEVALMKLTSTLKDHLGHWEKSGATVFVRSVIEQGYMPKFRDLPEGYRYEERNNKSYHEYREFANEAVMKLVKNKVVREVSRGESKCVSPLSVAVKNNKKRLCLDLSRGVNKFCESPKFKIRSLKEVAASVEKDDFGFSFDLRSFYFQVPLHPDFVGYLGFKIEDDKGDCRFFEYTMLPFGFVDAARAVTKLLKAPLKNWRSWGARVAEAHIDDVIVFAAGKEKVLDLSRRVHQDLLDFGLLISEDKCSWGARTRIQWVGFVWDTRKFMLYLPEDKLERVLRVVEELWKKEGERVHIKEVASVCGLLGSIRPAVGDIARFRTRELLMMVARGEQEVGWGGKVVLSEGAVRELMYWHDKLQQLNGCLIRSDPGVVVVQQRWFVSDAGEFMIGGVEWSKFGKKEGSEFQFHLTEEQSEASSTEREMLGQLWGLRKHARELAGCSIRWTCDNWAASIIHRVGSMKPRLQKLAVEMWQLEKEYNMVVEWEWQPRTVEAVVCADKISKDFDFSDFRLSGEDFKMLDKRFGPFSCDFFASDLTYRMKPFVARYKCEGASGVDAFSMEWGKGGFFHPPVNKIVEMVRYAREQGAQGTLVTPSWEDSTFWAYLKLVDGLVERMRFRPFLKAPAFFKNKTFVGEPKFDFSVFSFSF